MHNLSMFILKQNKESCLFVMLPLALKVRITSLIAQSPRNFYQVLCIFSTLPFHWEVPTLSFFVRYPFSNYYSLCSYWMFPFSLLGRFICCSPRESFNLYYIFLDIISLSHPNFNFFKCLWSLYLFNNFILTFL